jgi:plasmid stabilization system protein ParE
MSSAHEHRFRVELSGEAQANIQEIAEYIRQHGPADPRRWLDGLDQKLAALKDFASWCALAPEDDFTEETIRQSLYGPFRILFIIRDDVVHVITVRHGARQFLSANDIDRLTDL